MGILQPQDLWAKTKRVHEYYKNPPQVSYLTKSKASMGLCCALALQLTMWWVIFNNIVKLLKSYYKSYGSHGISFPNLLVHIFLDLMFAFGKYPMESQFKYYTYWLQY
ncbi:hypothetical protein DX873_12680 [Flagellimonas nanhaiensis]|uniref:Uncharacterized protein n=1 Tax=Flagellimonas nanhaiensis TaxID=2292706 RepID=A0A371JRN9_9FLAO|nr:hypothetical protein DX873_12680 [Allomuricauda nanhaiensis]